MPDINSIHKVLFNFEKRAENKPDEVIASTFVDAAPLLDILQAPVSQVIFGRRGTGKTHALKYCLASAREGGDSAVYLDIRSIGSNGSFYSDGSVPDVERGLALVNDILKSLLDELYSIAVQKIDQGFDSRQITIRLDDMADAIGNVRLSGVVEVSEECGLDSSDAIGFSGAADISSAGPKASLQAKFGEDHATTKKNTMRRSGQEHRFIDFSRTQSALKGLLDILAIDRMWLFLDEWSETPRAIQPHLADLIRKTILPTGKVGYPRLVVEKRPRRDSTMTRTG